MSSSINICICLSQKTSTFYHYTISEYEIEGLLFKMLEFKDHENHDFFLTNRSQRDKFPWMREKPYIIPDIYLDLVQDELTKCLTDMWGGAVKSLK